MSPSAKDESDFLLDRLAANAAKTPNKMAVGFITPGPQGGNLQKKMTYKELEEETTRIACFLLEKGVKKGDRCVSCN